MTREEAIELVKSAFDVWEDKYSVGNDMNREHKARDMAIKALEQEHYKDFCEFVAKMVLRDDFEENAGANAESLCRKLSKLGIVKANEDEWVLVESEDEK